MRWPPRILGAPVPCRDLITGAVILLVAGFFAAFVRMPKSREQEQHEYILGMVELCAQECRLTHSMETKQAMEKYLRMLLGEQAREVIRYQLLTDGIEVETAGSHGPELVWVRFD
jgi:hypothetical protein